MPRPDSKLLRSALKYTKACGLRGKQAEQVARFLTTELLNTLMSKTDVEFHHLLKNLRSKVLQLIKK